MKITVDEDALLTVLHECVRRLLGEFQITEVDGNMREYAKQFLTAIKNCDWYAGLGGDASKRQAIPVVPRTPTRMLAWGICRSSRRRMRVFFVPEGQTPDVSHLSDVEVKRLPWLDEPAQSRWAVESSTAGVSAPGTPHVGTLRRGQGLGIVDRILCAVAECHDRSELWSHLRQDPSAFRMAVRAALKQFGSDAARSSEVELLLAAWPTESP